MRIDKQAWRMLGTGWGEGKKKKGKTAMNGIR